MTKTNDDIEPQDSITTPPYQTPRIPTKEPAQEAAPPAPAPPAAAPAAPIPFEPTNASEAAALAAWLAKSTLLADDIRHQQPNIFAILLAGHELRLPPMQALRGLRIQKGNLVLAADLMVAQCQRKPDICEYFQLVESTDQVATYETLRKGAPRPTTLSWTVEQAKAAGLLTKSVWVHRAAMLRARASSALARAVYPDLVHGIYTPEEAAEFRDATGPLHNPALDRPALTTNPEAEAALRNAQARQQAVQKATAPAATPSQRQADRLKAKAAAEPTIDLADAVEVRTCADCGEDHPTTETTCPHSAPPAASDADQRKAAAAAKRREAEAARKAKLAERKRRKDNLRKAQQELDALDASPPPAPPARLCPECKNAPGDCDPDCSLQGSDGPPVDDQEATDETRERDIPAADQQELPT